MMQKLIAFSLRHSSIVIVSAALLTLWAGLQLSSMPVDVFPELNAPTVAVLTEAGGLAADEVEQYVTFPIETSMNGLPGVRRVRSASATSLSIVWIEFGWSEDIYRARQLVAERLASVESELPAGVHAEMGPISSITGEIMLIALSSPENQVSELRIRSMAEFEMRNRLLAVPGVAQVVAIGGYLPEYTVAVTQAKLQLYGLTLEDVATAAGESHTIASAGYLANEKGLELPLRQTGRVKSVEDIRRTVISFAHDVPITIGDVAEVSLGGAPRRGAAADQGRAAVVLSIQKAPGTNTLELTKAVDGVLDVVEESLPAGVELNRFAMRQSDFIETAVSNVVLKLRDASIVTALVLVMFLLNLRTTLITLVALPLSISMALLFLWAVGLTVNVMTLGGLAVAIGELVDDAIIDVENVFRRLRQNIARPEAQRKPFVRVIFDASNEIRSSVVYATFVITVVFVPLLFLQGLEGRFFRPLGITYIVAILSSLLVAMTVTPALCRVLLRGKLGGSTRESFLVRWLKVIYDRGLAVALRLRVPVLALALCGTAAALWLGSTFGTAFLPSFNEGTFTLFLMAPPGTSLESSDRLARGIESQLTQIEGVRSVVRRTGRAERDEHAEPVSSSEIDVGLYPGVPKSQVRGEIDRILDQVPGITTMVGQPIEHRLSHVLSGTPAAIAINVYGDDLARLREIAKEIEVALRQMPGARDVAANREQMVTTLPIRYRLEDLTRWGLTPAHAADQVSTAFNGKVVNIVNDGVHRYNLTVRLVPEEREDRHDVRQFLLHGASGQMVRLSEVADIGPEQVSNLIARENTQRKATVSCNVAEGYNLGQLVEKVKVAVDPIVAESGYQVRYGGQFEAQQSASRMIGLMGLGVMAVVLMVLNTALGSLRAAILVMVNLPLAIIGGVVAIYISDSPDVLGNTAALLGLSGERYISPELSIASLVGFITLFGIAVRNGILLVNHYHHLIQVEGRTVAEAVVQGSLERLVPILMTALTAVLALVPLAISAGKPGSELLAPLALVVLGGLTTSTFLNLFVVPAGYSLIFGRNPPPKPDSFQEWDGD